MKLKGMIRLSIFILRYKDCFAMLRPANRPKRFCHAIMNFMLGSGAFKDICGCGTSTWLCFVFYASKEWAVGPETVQFKPVIILILH